MIKLEDKKNEQNNFYDLFCLIEKSQKDWFTDKIREILGSGVAKITEEKNLEPAYKVKQLREGQYITVLFQATPEEAQRLKQNFLGTNKIRNILLNVRNKKEKTKLKTKKNN